MNNELKIIETNIVNALEALQEFTATPGCGVTRFPYTEEARAACAYLRERMEAVGLAVKWFPATGHKPILPMRWIS